MHLNKSIKNKAFGTRKYFRFQDKSVSGNKADIYVSCFAPLGVKKSLFSSQIPCSNPCKKGLWVRSLLFLLPLLPLCLLPFHHILISYHLPITGIESKAYAIEFISITVCFFQPLYGQFFSRKPFCWQPTKVFIHLV